MDPKWTNEGDHARRETKGGIQRLYPDGTLYQSGYAGPVYRGTTEACLQVADEMSRIEDLRIAGKDSFEFYCDTRDAVARAVAMLISPRESAVEEGLREVNFIESMAAALRARLVERQEGSYLAQVEAIVALATSNFVAFYAALNIGAKDPAENSLAVLESLVAVARARLDLMSNDDTKD